MNRIFLFLKGMAMGAADVVPGVSGGTIAFITGIYEELLNSIKSVSGHTFTVLFKEGLPAAWRQINGTFLIILLAGIATSVLSLAKGLNHLLETQPVLIWSFFFGLIVASAWLIGKSVKKWQAGTVAALLVGLGIAYYITVATPAQTSEAYWFIFLSGALAICAMILPGISGSFILLLLGKYKFIIEALSEFKWQVIAIFILGCVAGLLTFARLLSWMFRHYHNLTIALLTGFMIGSLNKVWPWKKVLEWGTDRHGEALPLVEKSISPWAYAELPQNALLSSSNNPQLVWAIVAAFAGFAIIWVLERGSAKSSSNT